MNNGSALVGQGGPSHHLGRLSINEPRSGRTEAATVLL